MSTLFTHDAKFVLSGSDDGNVRIWKAKAHEKLGIIDSRERAAIEYRESLKQKWKADAQVSKVARYVTLSFYHCIIVSFLPWGKESPLTVLLTLSLVRLLKDPALAKTRIQGVTAQENDVGCTESQGGTKKETYAGGRVETESGEEDSCCHRTDIVAFLVCSTFSASSTLILGFFLIYSALSILRSSYRAPLLLPSTIVIITYQQPITLPTLSSSFLLFVHPIATIGPSSQPLRSQTLHPAINLP